MRISCPNTNQGLSCLFNNFCTTIAAIFSDSCVLIWVCSSDGNEPIILFNACSEDLACTVVNTKCHVSDNRIAFLILSKSLISQKRITSGLCLSAYFIASVNEDTSLPNSFWSMILSLGSKTYSIGSSIVRICFFLFILISSITAASVVDFQDPVGQAKNTIPFSLYANCLKIGGNHRALRVGIVFLNNLETIITWPLCLEILTLYLLSLNHTQRSRAPYFSK